MLKIRSASRRSIVIDPRSIKIKSLEEVRTELRKKIPRAAGQDGEAFAEKWLKANKWKYVVVEQGETTLSKDLRSYGGKRPDFLADAGDDSCIIALDAKYHSTCDGTSFVLCDDELGKYRNLKRFVEDKSPGKKCEVLFMVVPKEHSGSKLVWVSLDEFDNGKSTTLVGKPATAIRLDDRPTLWCDIDA
jgi:hypothetical protein